MYQCDPLHTIHQGWNGRPHNGVTTHTYPSANFTPSLEQSFNQLIYNTFHLSLISSKKSDSRKIRHEERRFLPNNNSCDPNASFFDLEPEANEE